MKRLVLSVFAILMSAGCATIGPEWTKISRFDVDGKDEKKKLYMQAMKKNNCTFVGDIKVNEPIHFGSIDPQEERRLASTDPEHLNYYARGFDNSIRKKTMESNGNVVITDFSQVGPITKELRGMAYRCNSLN